MTGRDIYLLRRSEEFHLDPGQEASINLPLKKAPLLPCTKLCGQVISGCRKIAGATVKILDKDFKPVCHTVTGKDGTFSLIDILFPGYYTVLVSAEDYLVSESRFISLPPFKPLSITIELTPDKDAKKAAVYGTVRNSENLPLPNTQVDIVRKENMEGPKNVAVTNEDGEYLFSDLMPGKYTLSASRYGYTLPENITVELFPEDLFCADIYLYRKAFLENGTVSGVVLHDGHTVPYAIAALYRTESNGFRLIQIQQTNSNGVYLFSDLPAGNYIVSAKIE